MCVANQGPRSLCFQNLNCVLGREKCKTGNFCQVLRQKSQEEQAFFPPLFLPEFPTGLIHQAIISDLSEVPQNIVIIKTSPVIKNCVSCEENDIFR